MTTVFSAVSLLFFASIVASLVTHNPVSLSNDSEITIPSATEPAPTVVKLAAMGDMLAHDTIINNAKQGSSYDF
ncbi:MAG TPA: hypothetical protein PLY16_00335, partial [Candidatus Saccharibacteria bacterium]|nr:hypothetical protein [Candidatus Saccharibacteria bacterium]